MYDDRFEPEYAPITLPFPSVQPSSQSSSSLHSLSEIPLLQEPATVIKEEKAMEASIASSASFSVPENSVGNIFMQNLRSLEQV